MYRGGSWLVIPYLINYERKYYVSPFASPAPASGATRADCSLSTATVPRRASAAFRRSPVSYTHLTLPTICSV